MRKFEFIVLSSLLFGCSDYELIKRDVGDVFYQVEAGEVDILLVVDNSCSMQPYQEKLASNFDAFLTFFVEGNVDYRIGVATTTVSDPPSPDGVYCTQADVDAVPEAGYLVQDTVIDANTSNASEIFSDLVNVGICGTGNEMGLESAKLSLDNVYNGLIREDAYLSVIFISDEQDTSPLGVNSYINNLRAVKDVTARNVFNASALVVQDLATCSTDQINSGATVGSRYIDVAQQADGIIGDICGDDFQSIVTDLSLNSSRLNDIFFLTQPPSLPSLVIGVDGEEIPCDGSGAYIWSYDLLEGDRPVIIFDRTTLPPPSAKITAQYNQGQGDPADFCGGTATEETEEETEQ